MKIRRKLVQLVALMVVAAVPVLGAAGVAAAKKNPVGSSKWCQHHPKKAKKVAACDPGGGGGGGDPSITFSPGNSSRTPAVETGQSEVHVVIQLEDAAAAEETVTVDSPSLQASCGGSITFSTLQGATVTSPPSGSIAPKTYTNQITLTLDDEGNATTVVSGTACAPGTDYVEASLPGPPYSTFPGGDLYVAPPGTSTAGVIDSYPSSEVETGDTAASGDSDVYAVFVEEADASYAEQLAEISDIQLESSCNGGWIWEPGNTAFSNSGNLSGNPGNTPPALKTTSGDEPYTTIDDDGNAEFTFMGISCAAADTGSTSTVTGDTAFNIPGNHGAPMGTFTVLPPQVT